MPKRQTSSKPWVDWTVKISVIVALASILFSMFCFVAAIAIGQGKEPPEIYVYFGSFGCGAFTLSAIVGGAAWLISASSGPSKGKSQRPKSRLSAEQASDSDEPPASDAADHDGEDVVERRRR